MHLVFAQIFPNPFNTIEEIWKSSLRCVNFAGLASDNIRWLELEMCVCQLSGEMSL